ncbi:carcinine hydrolase/isopenicillin-N N-acyltransferase family protein [Stratiformator vulcanicus]|uniref:Acyl-coenzyme A:6-aminopenicillanic acid acyl-transferase n=1 Tax=Stratiformator vulcanicus TaxID=2527980 RepID=A0A517QWM6_9PLAN|nr:carcinine hydrolase/isopenicillin-N N-acyltransferase family protein [Stratiformator vulcanicus]QDT36075.1 Acyl-coenzyme A:6-aminopenicillanic acid acyl-transferase [Stratiformator vulcanicus]
MTLKLITGTAALCLGLTAQLQATACTTAVISGRATIDGRPLLWKNRDFWQRDNEIVCDDTGKFRYVAVANAGATEGMRMGVNSAGLCIENSQSSDMSGDRTTGPNNGRLIRMALENCATAKDFIRLLDETNESGRRTRGNFGVIDASGAAMMFEVGPRSYRAYDANSERDAPQGFIVRSNFSFKGLEESGTTPTDFETIYSGDRFCRATELCIAGAADDKLSESYLLSFVSRDIGEAIQTGFNFTNSPTRQSVKATPQLVNTTSTLNRKRTVSAAVIRGVLKDEPASMTTMWVLLGEPLLTVAVPCWAEQGAAAPETTAGGQRNICDLSTSLRKQFYRSENELDTNQLYSVSVRLNQLESELLEKVDAERKRWQTNPPQSTQLLALHSSASAEISKLLVALNGSTSDPANTDSPVEPVAIDFHFSDENGTKLGEAKNSASSESWDGGMTKCVVKDGAFRIRRNSDKAVNRYVPLDHPIRVRAPRGTDKVPKGYLILEVSGWNLTGDKANEILRFGFTSQSEKNYQTAGFVVERTGPDTVSLSGAAFGEGSSDIATDIKLPAHLKEPISLALELDKVENNPDEGESGGVYRLYLKRAGESEYQQIGDVGQCRRLRNGNAVHLRVDGRFGDDKEYFDIDRLYFTTLAP